MSGVAGTPGSVIRVATVIGNVHVYNIGYGSFTTLTMGSFTDVDTGTVLSNLHRICKLTVVNTGGVSLAIVWSNAGVVYGTLNTPRVVAPGDAVTMAVYPSGGAAGIQQVGLITTNTQFSLDLADSSTYRIGSAIVTVEAFSILE